MEVVDLIVAARWVAPVEPAEAVLEDHALVVRGGRILDLLPTGEARTRYRAERWVDRPRHLLIPGLVNTHTHAAMTLFRGLADDLPLMAWLNEHIWPAERQWVGPEFVREGTELAAAEMLRSGTTCFQDMYFFPDQVARVAAEAGMRAVVGMIVIDFPTAWASGADEYLEKGVALHDRYRDHPLVRTAFAPHAPYTVQAAVLERVVVMAEELDVPVHMHVHETEAEIRQSLEDHGERPLARLDALGLLGPRLVAVHMTQLEQDEIERCAEAGVHVAHCPESNLKLASGLCPTHRLLVAGVNVALGTDGAASNNDLDLLGEMRTAALLAKAVAGDAAAVPAHRALAMATLHGARALGLEEEIGSLVPGKAADAVAVDLGGLEAQPLYHPVSQLVYAAGRSQVTDVWVAGRPLLEEGRLTTLDEEALAARARAWQERIRRYG